MSCLTIPEGLGKDIDVPREPGVFLSRLIILCRCLGSAALGLTPRNSLTLRALSEASSLRALIR